MKRRAHIGLAIIISVILLSGFVVVGCGDGNGDGITPDGPEPPETIELSFGHTLGPENATSQVLVEWMDKIAEETDGRVHITPYWSSTLIGGTTNYADLQARVADIGYLSVAMTEPASFPLCCLLEWAYFGVDSWEVEEQVGREIYELFPELQAEGSKVKMLNVNGMGQFYIHTTSQPIYTLEDLQGLELIGATFGVPGATFDELGASPTIVPGSEFFTTIQKGIAEGMVTPITQMATPAFQEVLKYHVALPMWSGINGAPYLAMNLDCWNELPADIQQVFEDNIDWLSAEFVALTQSQEAVALDYIASAPDQELTILSAEDLATFADMGWAKLLEEATKVDDMGLPGTEMILKCRELIEQYSD